MAKRIPNSLLHRLLISLIAAGILTGSALGEPVLRSVSVEGNQRFSNRKLITWSGLKLNKPLPQGAVEKAALNILQRLADEGYYFSRIDSVRQNYTADSARVDLTLFLTEGDALILKALDLTGDSLDTDRPPLLLSQPEKPVYAGILQADLEEILHTGQETGYPFARLTVKDLDMEDDSLRLQAHLTSGPRVKLEKVRVIGLESTQPRVVAREARIVPGQLYSSADLTKGRQRILKLPFIGEVSQAVLIPLGSDRYDALYQVEETRSNSFDGVVGYQPASDGEKGQVTGLLDLTFMNLFGTGRKAKIHWERTSEFRQALDLYYEEPWIFGFPFNLWGEFRQEIQDSLYLERLITGGVTWEATEALSLRGSVFQEEVLPDSAGREYLGLYKSISIGGALAVEYEGRDYPDNPLHGLYYFSSFSTSEKDYESSSGLGNPTVRRYESDVNWSHPIYRRQVLNLQLHGRFIESDEDPIPQPDLFRLGGAQTLRGYREEQFLGHLVSWGSVEYRLWMDKLSRIYAFFNLGYYEFKSPADGILTEEWPWGYGVGFRQGTRLGIIGFDFALGEDDVLATAKVHFRLINRF